VRPLGRLHFAVVGRRDHPALRRQLTTSRWLAYAHVVVRIGNGRTDPVDDALVRARLDRVVGLEVPSFSAGLLALRSSDLLMNAPTPIVDDVAESLQLKVRSAPISLPSIRLGLLFHERHKQDAAHGFSRERILAAFASLLSG